MFLKQNKSQQLSGIQGWRVLWEPPGKPPPGAGLQGAWGCCHLLSQQPPSAADTRMAARGSKAGSVSTDPSLHLTPRDGRPERELAGQARGSLESYLHGEQGPARASSTGGARLRPLPSTALTFEAPLRWQCISVSPRKAEVLVWERGHLAVPCSRGQMERMRMNERMDGRERSDT